MLLLQRVIILFHRVRLTLHFYPKGCGFIRVSRRTLQLVANLSMDHNFVLEFPI